MIFYSKDCSRARDQKSHLILSEYASIERTIVGWLVRRCDAHLFLREYWYRTRRRGLRPPVSFTELQNFKAARDVRVCPIEFIGGEVEQISNGVAVVIASFPSLLTLSVGHYNRWLESLSFKKPTLRTYSIFVHTRTMYNTYLRVFLLTVKHQRVNNYVSTSTSFIRQQRIGFNYIFANYCLNFSDTKWSLKIQVVSNYVLESIFPFFQLRCTRAASPNGQTSDSVLNLFRRLKMKFQTDWLWKAADRSKIFDSVKPKIFNIFTPTRQNIYSKCSHSNQVPGHFSLMGHYN